MVANMQIWNTYYAHFDIDGRGIRPGCEPRLFLHHKPRKHAIVLVHGLTDSPHFMAAIVEYFHEMMGFDVKTLPVQKRCKV